MDCACLSPPTEGNATYQGKLKWLIRIQHEGWAEQRAEPFAVSLTSSHLFYFAPRGLLAEKAVLEVSHLVSVLIFGLSYGAMNVLSYTRRRWQTFLRFRDSPIIPLRQSPTMPGNCVPFLQNFYL